MRGNENKQFKPNDYITRQDLAITLTNLLNQNTSYGNANRQLKDISKAYGQTSIELLVQLGVINGYSDDTFRPYNYITRAEAVVLINNLLKNFIEVDNYKKVDLTLN